MDAVIAGSVEEANAMDLGSVHNAQGTIQMSTEAGAANLCNTAQMHCHTNIHVDTVCTQTHATNVRNFNNFEWLCGCNPFNKSNSPIIQYSFFQ